MGSCEILQGSWKQITSWKKCGGKLEEVCANVSKSLYNLWHFASALCRKSLYKSTENEEAGKAQNRANVRKCAQYLYKSTEN